MIQKSSFKPAWWLLNRHLQTIVPRIYKVPCSYQPYEEVFELTDDDFVETIWTCPPENIRQSQPVVLVLHGLEGSYDSFYAKRMMEAIYQQGWQAVIMQFRGCGKQPNRKAHSYHSGQTEDVAAYIDFLRKTLPNNPLFAVGFSLGGNVLGKYLGEKPESGLEAGVIISAPLDLAICADVIGGGFSKIYQKYLMDKLKTSITQKIEQFGDNFPVKVSEQQLNALKTLTEFDNLFTAPLNGFANAQDYYQKASCNQYLKNCDTPCLIIHAKDDPFMSDHVIPKPEELSPKVSFELSNRGGHVGFISGHNPFKPKFWTELKTVDYFTTIMASRS